LGHGWWLEAPPGPNWSGSKAGLVWKYVWGLEGADFRCK
jgi:hypothetical protein